MPIFEYHCRACGQNFEKIRREPADTVPCPACGEAAERSVSVFAAGPAGGGGGCAAPGGSGFT